MTFDTQQSRTPTHTHTAEEEEHTERSARAVSVKRRESVSALQEAV